MSISDDDDFLLPRSPKISDEQAAASAARHERIREEKELQNNLKGQLYPNRYYMDLRHEIKVKNKKKRMQMVVRHKRNWNNNEFLLQTDAPTDPIDDNKGVKQTLESFNNLDRRSQQVLRWIANACVGNPFRVVRYQSMDKRFNRDSTAFYAKIAWLQNNKWIYCGRRRRRYCRRQINVKVCKFGCYHAWYYANYF